MLAVKNPPRPKRKRIAAEPVQPSRKSRRIAKQPPSSTEEKTEASPGKGITSAPVPGKHIGVPRVERPRTLIRTRETTDVTSDVGDSNAIGPGPATSGKAEETKESAPRPVVQCPSLGHIAGTTTHEAVRDKKRERAPEVTLEEDEPANEHLPTPTLRETSPFAPVPYPKIKVPTTKARTLPVKSDRITRSTTRRQAKDRERLDPESKNLEQADQAGSVGANKQDRRAFSKGGA